MPADRPTRHRARSASLEPRLGRVPKPRRRSSVSGRIGAPSSPLLSGSSSPSGDRTAESPPNAPPPSLASDVVPHLPRIQLSEDSKSSADSVEPTGSASLAPLPSSASARTTFAIRPPTTFRSIALSINSSVGPVPIAPLVPARSRSASLSSRSLASSRSAGSSRNESRLSAITRGSLGSLGRISKSSRDIVGMTIEGPPATAPIVSANPTPTAARLPAAVWTAAADRTLIEARKAGMNWKRIAEVCFPTKTPNACRKRWERLIQRSTADPWDDSRYITLAVDYYVLRPVIWGPLADRLGESWMVIEEKIMEKGLKYLLSHGQQGRIPQAGAWQSTSHDPISDSVPASATGPTPSTSKQSNIATLIAAIEQDRAQAGLLPLANAAEALTSTTRESRMALAPAESRPEHVINDDADSDCSADVRSPTVRTSMPVSSLLRDD